MIVARQLQSMSTVPRTLGDETKLCGSDDGMVQLGLVKVWALTRVIDSAMTRTKAMTLVLALLVRTRDGLSRSRLVVLNTVHGAIPLV